MNHVSNHFSIKRVIRTFLIITLASTLCIFSVFYCEGQGIKEENSNDYENSNEVESKETYVTHAPVAGVSRILPNSIELLKLDASIKVYASGLISENTSDTVKQGQEEDIEINEEETVEEIVEVIEEPKRSNKIYCIVDNGYTFNLPEDYQDYLWEMCIKYSVEEYYSLFIAQMYHESGFTVNTISETNDYGLMQINKCNHDWLGKELGNNDFLDPYNNIEAGVYIMSDFLHKYNDVQTALVCYNRGESAVKNGTYSTSYSRGILQDMSYLVEIN